MALGRKWSLLYPYQPNHLERLSHLQPNDYRKEFFAPHYGKGLDPKKAGEADCYFLHNPL